MEETPHIAIFPSPGMGHLIPLTEFAKKLVVNHSFLITFIIPTCGAPSEAHKATLEALPQGINHVFLPPITFKENFEGIEGATRVCLTVERSLPSFYDVFKSLVSNSRIVALIFDANSTGAYDFAKDYEIPCYLFFTSPAMLLCWYLYLPKLDEMVSCEDNDSPEPVQIPGCVPVHRRDLILDTVQHRKTNAYNWFLYHSKRFILADGIIVNSFVDLEPGPIKALQVLGKPLVYPIGPVVRDVSSRDQFIQCECLQWLDNQPRGSVLYVSFGSGGTLSFDQFSELALGLEMSGQRFLWVVKSPNDKTSNAAYFSVQSQDDPLGFLPKGFLVRTKGRAMVVSSWAPQVQILSHGSIGGFLTHCGWNSVLESVVNGVPLIAWPLFAEQKMNAVMLTKELKVALRLKSEENGLVSRREEIAKVVKEIIEGEDGMMLRNRMLGLRGAATKTLGKDGSSSKLLHELVHKWKTSRCLDPII